MKLNYAMEGMWLQCLYRKLKVEIRRVFTRCQYHANHYGIIYDTFRGYTSGVMRFIGGSGGVRRGGFKKPSPHPTPPVVLYNKNFWISPVDSTMWRYLNNFTHQLFICFVYVYIKQLSMAWVFNCIVWYNSG